MQVTVTGSRIDVGGEFNQTDEHDHRPGNACWCGFGVGSAVASPFGELPAARKPKTLYDAYERPEMFGKKVSPAIAEQRIVMLEAELKREREEHAKTYEKLLTAQDRIAGYERHNAALAEAVDNAATAFKNLTGRTLELVASEPTPLRAA